MRSPNKYCQNCYPVAKLFLAICDPMGCSKSGFPVHHQLPEPAQTHVHRVNDAIQPSHPLSPFLFLPSIFPSLKVFSSESALRNQVAKVLELRLQHQCFQWVFRVKYCQNGQNQSVGRESRGDCSWLFHLLVAAITVIYGFVFLLHFVLCISFECLVGMHLTACRTHWDNLE